MPKKKKQAPQDMPMQKPDKPGTRHTNPMDAVNDDLHARKGKK